MELKDAYRMVIDDIDADMEAAPNQQLADLSNALEDRLKEIVGG